MSGDENFQQRWGIRERDDGLDSSSDDPEPSSDPKKCGMVTNFELPGSDGISNIPLLHHANHLEPPPPPEGFSSEFGKFNKAIKKTAKKGSSRKGNSKKKKKNVRVHGTFKAVEFDDFKGFMKSVIDELKDARNEMFSCMREEMDKLVRPAKPVPKPRRKKQEQDKSKVELNKRARKSAGSTRKRPTKRNTAADLNKCREIIEDRASPVKNIEAIPSNENSKVDRPLSRSIAVSSPFLSFPTVPPEPRAQNQNVLESTKFQHDGYASGGYLSGIQVPEHMGNVPQMGFHNMGYLNQQITHLHHQGLRNGFNIPNQALENSPQGNHLLGLRIDGGAMRYPGTNHALLGHFVAGNSGAKPN